MVYGPYSYSYWGEPKPTNITGWPHIVGRVATSQFQDSMFTSMTLMIMTKNHHLVVASGLLGQITQNVATKMMVENLQHCGEPLRLQRDRNPKQSMDLAYFTPVTLLAIEQFAMTASTI